MIHILSVSFRISDAFETGLLAIWLEEAQLMANMIIEKNEFPGLSKPSPQMVLDEIKIGLGPYIIGVCFALFGLFLEYSIGLQY